MWLSAQHMQAWSDRLLTSLNVNQQKSNVMSQMTGHAFILMSQPAERKAFNQLEAVQYSRSNSQHSDQLMWSDVMDKNIWPCINLCSFMHAYGRCSAWHVVMSCWQAYITPRNRSIEACCLIFCRNMSNRLSSKGDLCSLHTCIWAMQTSPRARFWAYTSFWNTCTSACTCTELSAKVRWAHSNMYTAAVDTAVDHCWDCSDR